MTKLTAAVAAILCAALAWSVQAQQPWPAKSLRLLTAVPAGSAPDIIARLVMDPVSKALDQPVVIEPVPAANGIVAMQRVKASAPDGYTFAFLHSSAAVVTPYTYKAARYDVEKDVEAVAAIANAPMLIVANNDASARTLSEVIEQAKKSPGTVVMGNPIRTSIPHLAAELISQRSGAQFNHVWFNSTPMGIQAAIKGDAQYYIDGTAPLMPMIKAGRVRAIAVTSSGPLAGLEGIPLANATIPGMNVLGWFVLFAVAGTPQPIKQRMNDEINKALQIPEVVARLSDLGTYPMPGSISDAAKFVRDEKALWSGVIKNAGIQAE